MADTLGPDDPRWDPTGRDLDAAFDDIVAHLRDSDSPSGSTTDAQAGPGTAPGTNPDSDTGSDTDTGSGPGARPVGGPRATGAHPVRPGTSATHAVNPSGEPTDRTGARGHGARSHGGPVPGDTSDISRPGRPVSPAGFVVPPQPGQGEHQEQFGWRGYSAPDVEDEFVPPAPEPMPDPESDPQFWAIVGCLTVGPLLLILLVLTGRTSMHLLMVLAVAATVVGFVLLVLRGGREPRDPHDDGARV